MRRLHRSQLLALGGIVVLLSAAIPLSLAVPGMVLDDTPPLAAVRAAEGGVASVEVLDGAMARDVAIALASQEAIDSARRFEVLVSLLGYAGRLTPGLYDFEPGLVTLEIIERIHDGVTSAFVITIPEGLRMEEIAARLDDVGIADRNTFLAAANSANWEGTLAVQRPVRASLEGYLFPSTYRFSLTVTPDEAVRSMLERFDAQITPERRTAIGASGRTLHDILTIASIVEREAVLPEEQPLIASVFWNRVKAGMRLEADPTVQYAVASQPGSALRHGYWKIALTEADLALISPYNTYRNTGLPPTPIAAPGITAIDAAISPAESTFRFFVAAGDGSHLFAETFEGHLENVQRVQS